LKVQEQYQHQPYGHCETGVVSSLLRHHGLDLSEPMVFGLASGLMFAFVPFLKMNGMPVVAYRVFPKFIIRGIQSRLGMKFRKLTYRDPQKAMNDLDTFIDAGQVVGLQVNIYWLPFFPPEQRVQINVHNIVIFGKENGEYLVSDPAFKEVVTIKREDLQKARFAKGQLAPKGYLYYPIFIPEDINIGKMIRASIKRTIWMMSTAPAPCGLRGISYMANKIEKMDQKKDFMYTKLFLGHIARMQEEVGTGGGGYRFMYAAFLQEAYKTLTLPVLQEASAKMTETGDLWRGFALACAKGFRSRNGNIDLSHIAQLLRKCYASEREVYGMLKNI